MITASFGAVSTCFTGPANAILVSGGDTDRHYAAGVMASLLAIFFGLFSPAFTQLMLATPKVFVATLAGLAFLKVLERAFVVSFNGVFTFGASFGCTFDAAKNFGPAHGRRRDEFCAINTGAQWLTVSRISATSSTDRAVVDPVSCRLGA